MFPVKRFDLQRKYCCVPNTGAGLDGQVEVEREHLSCLSTCHLLRSHTEPSSCRLCWSRRLTSTGGRVSLYGPETKCASEGTLMSKPVTRVFGRSCDPNAQTIMQTDCRALPLTRWCCPLSIHRSKIQGSLSASLEMGTARATTRACGTYSWLEACLRLRTPTGSELTLAWAA